MSFFNGYIYVHIYLLYLYYIIISIYIYMENALIEVYELSMYLYAVYQ